MSQIKVLSKQRFMEVQHKYHYTETIYNKIENANDSDVLILEVIIPLGGLSKLWINKIWILNEESEEVFLDFLKRNKNEN